MSNKPAQRRPARCMNYYEDTLSGVARICCFVFRPYLINSQIYPSIRDDADKIREVASVKTSHTLGFVDVTRAIPDPIKLTGFS